MTLARVFLIGGTSHTGKSTTARAIATSLAADRIATDVFARHPGRPWPSPDSAVRPHVADYYATTNTAQLVEDVVRHYERLQPHLLSLQTLRQRDKAAPDLVIEGSCVMPRAGMNAVWLYVKPDVIADRMYKESAYANLASKGQRLVDAFLDRTLAFQSLLMARSDELGLPLLDVSEVDDAAAACLDSLLQELVE